MQVSIKMKWLFQLTPSKVSENKFICLIGIESKVELINRFKQR